MVALYIFFIVLNLIFGIKCKRNKYVIFLSYLFIFILMSLNTENADLNSYINEYNLSAKGLKEFSEFGYFWLSRIFNFFNFNFYVYHIFITAVGLILIQSTIKYFNANESIVIGLYLLYTVFMDIIQIRNFILESILIFSLRYLFINKKFNTIKFILCILVAALFHKTALIYLILIFFKLDLKFGFYTKLLAFSCCIFVFFAIFRQPLVSIVNTAVSFVGLQTSYVITTTRFSFIGIAAVYLIDLIVLMQYEKYCRKVLNKQDVEVKFLKIYILLSLLLPLLLLNASFYRFFRNLSIMKFIVFALYYEKSIIHKRKNNWLSVAFIFTNIGWAIVDFCLLNDFESVISPILYNNLLITNSVKGIEYAVMPLLILIVIFSLIITFLPKAKQRRKHGGIVCYNSNL